MAPLLVVAGWAALTAAVVRRYGLEHRGWAPALAGLAAPTVVFVAGRRG